MRSHTIASGLNIDHQVFSNKDLEESDFQPKRIYLLLHGYLLSGKIVYEHFQDIFPDDSLVIAPNGPFPVPVKKQSHFKMKYAWYFFDPYTKNYYINFEPAAKYLQSILEHFPKAPTTVIGYSQGGYLAPKAAEVCSQIDSVIGLCANFRENRFKPKNIPYYLINSQNDLVVDYENAKLEFEKIKNNSGRLITMPNAVHRLGEEHREYLKELIKKIY